MLESHPTDGFAFVEFVDRRTKDLCDLFHRMGFRETRRSGAGDVVVLEQNEIVFIVNARGNPFRDAHGASARGIGVRAPDPVASAARTVAAGAESFNAAVDGAPIVETPTVRGIGGSLLYFVPVEGADPIAAAFAPHVGEEVPTTGLVTLDHVSNIVRPENLDRWADFYAESLAFTEKQYLDVRGRSTGMRARSMVSACGRVRIPIAASAHDDPGVLNQNDEFIRDYGGEGVQHLALATDDIFATVDALRAGGIEFMDRPNDVYYEDLAERVPGHGFDLERMRERGLLLDGKSGEDSLLQIFSRRQIGPIFFELIQRNNHEGFGAGNFKALFESQEKDQLRRGVNAGEQAA